MVRTPAGSGSESANRREGDKRGRHGHRCRNAGAWGRHGGADNGEGVGERRGGVRAGQGGSTTSRARGTNSVRRVSSLQVKGCRGVKVKRVDTGSETV